MRVPEGVSKLIHISDPHFERAFKKDNSDLLRGLEESAVALRREGADLIIATGDLTSHGTTQTIELEMARDWLDSLGCPAMVIPGNHDLGANRDRGVFDPDSEQYEDVAFRDTRYGSVFGDCAVQTRLVNGVQIVGIALRSGDVDGSIAELDAAIGSQVPTIVAGHYPIVQVRDQGPLPIMQPIDGWLGAETAFKLRSVVLAHDNVIAYCCGHVHASTARMIDGRLIQISAGALGPGPSVYRSYTVQNGKMLVETRFGAGPLGFWERLGDLEDSPEEYHLGTSRERTFSIEYA
ncbi:MAG: metallophosphoesterase family protein [Ferrimicrobium sp.]